MSQSTRQVAIIGAGPGGLAAAMLLAKAGLKVTVFERLPQVGGRTAPIRAEGYTFDIGPTFFLYPQALQRIFQACGFDLHREVELKRLDPQYRVHFLADRRHIDCTGDLERMVERVRAFSPGDEQGFRRFLADNRGKFAAIRPCLESPFQGLGDLLTMRMLRLLPKLRPFTSLWDDLGRHFRDERMRLVCTFQSKYLGMSPWSCPSMFSILSYLEYEHGIWHPLGGCNALTAAMARLAQGMGVTIRLGEAVEGIRWQGRRAVAVRTRAGETPCDALVVNADFCRAMTRLVPDGLRRRWNDARIAKAGFSCSTFMLYLGLEGAVGHLPHHTIFISEDYRRNLEEIERSGRPPGQPSFYIHNASVTDPGLAPPGHSAIYVLVPVPHQGHGIDWTREKDGFRAKVLKRLEEAGIADIERRIRYEKVVTPLDWDTGMEIHLGATFNLAHNFGQMLDRRPRNRFDDLDGVYLVGGGTHPGSGLPVIFESARISAGLMLEDLGLDGAFLQRSVE